MITDKPTMIYLAEPIDQARGLYAGPANDLQLHLEHAGWGVFRPRTAWVAGRLDPRVDQINRKVLAKADCIVAALPAGVPSIGVPTEIEAATAAGTPAVVLHDGDSQVLAGNPLVTVIKHPSEVVAAVSLALRTHPAGGLEPLRVIVEPGTPAPARGYRDDAGFDLTTSGGPHVVEPGAFADLPTRIRAIQLPVGYWGLVVGRSSAIRERGLLVIPSVIDPGYRGPMLVGVQNLGIEPATVLDGDRIGQIVPISAVYNPIEVAERVAPSPRGDRGFGSTGR